MQPLMLHSSIYQRAFVAAVIFFALQQFPALWSTLKLRLGDRSETRDRGSFSVVQILVIVGVLAGFEAALHLTPATITWHRPLVFFIGIGIMVLGSIISWLAVRQLGRYFTVVVAVREDQPVIQTGLYRFIRHPSYAGQLLVYLGFAVTLTNWISIPAIVICTVAGYGYRILIEEQALQSQLGSAYADYMTRTRRLIPGVW